MQLPVEISYRNVTKNDDIDDLIRSKAERLEKFCDHITSCRVAVEQPNHAQRSGNPYWVWLDIIVLFGHELVVDEWFNEYEMYEFLHKVINDAFKVAERQLKELVQRQRAEIKTHVEPRALITRIFREEGYGFITDLEGRELYFNRNSLLDEDFDKIKEGAEVRYSEEMGEKGLQASSVHVVSTGGPKY